MITQENTNPLQESLSATSATPAAGSRRRIEGIDGLRALAALLVLGYHLVPGSIQAGFVGVDMFFVISGFLITALLMREWNANGTIKLGHFWVRRIRRLVPAVVVATLGSLALARLAGGDALVQLRWQSLGSLTGTYNWFEIAHGSSYFEQQSPLLLTNMWSLAVEQQFYFVWPFLLLLILLIPQKKVRIGAAAALGALSVGEHVLLVLGTDDVTRAYVGTDSHSFGLMIGACLALAYPWAMSSDVPERSSGARFGWHLAGSLALLAVVIDAIALPESRWMYPWGMLVFCVLIAVTIRSLLPDLAGSHSGLLAQFLNSKPLVWLGERSYGIYLWHWPLWVIAFYTLEWPTWVVNVLVAVFSIVFAHLSYVYIETPIRTRHFGAWLRSVMSSVKAMKKRGIVIGIIALIVVGLAAVALVTSKQKSSAEEFVEIGEEASASAVPTPQGTGSQNPKSQQGTGSESGSPSGKNDGDNTGKPNSMWSGIFDSAKPVTGDEVTIIGDSVTVAATPGLQQALPGAYIDGKVSRSIRKFDEVATQMQQDGNLRPFVVVSLATNSQITSRDIDSMLSFIGPDRKLVLVTGHGPQRDSWIEASNSAIKDAATAHPDRIAVADWDSIASDHSDLLAGDQVHPGPAASRLYAAEIKRALESF
ncbi:MAG: acyltransferase family protein [Actinomycetaceae bacterium]|nr:acyltransferase family protein [Actinomycetaceae bacterium]MDY6082383.1 acyltransferase family protein [Actinomycetaceae bacterium]